MQMQATGSLNLYLGFLPMGGFLKVTRFRRLPRPRKLFIRKNMFRRPHQLASFLAQMSPSPPPYEAHEIRSGELTQVSLRWVNPPRRLNSAGKYAGRPNGALNLAFLVDGAQPD